MAESDRRAEIIEVATRIFYEKGYGNTSIQEIADELNLLKGSLYHYIRSKEELLVAIIDVGHAQMAANLEQTLDDTKPAIVVLRELVELHVLAHLANYRASRVFVHDMNSLPPDARRRILAGRHRYESAFRGLIERGIAERTMCPDIDTNLAAKALLTMLNAIHLWHVANGKYAPEDIAGQYGDLAIGSLRCTPRTHKPGHRRS